MQKIYSRIEWENEPSTETPLNEDNLNRMDSAIDVIDTRVVDLYGYEERAEESAEDSEAYAIGTRDGDPVTSTDPTYHNNSKYYSELSSFWAHHPPYIGTNGNWYIYDTTSEEFVDSGIDASITVSIADITMLNPDATPYVTNSGTNTDPIFHLFIPRGKGISNITKTSTAGLVDTYTITFSDGATYTYNVTNGKSAYQSAVEGGYEKTEQEFYEDLGNFEDYADAAAESAASAADDANDAANILENVRQYSAYIIPDLYFDPDDAKLYIKDPAGASVSFAMDEARLYWKLA